MTSAPRTLILMRHGHADAGDGSDIDRELTVTGRSAARATATALAAEAGDPALVLVSEARRTRETWMEGAAALGASAQVVFSEALYLATPRTLQRQIEAADDGARTLMLVGHNPGLSALANGLDPRVMGLRPADAYVFRSDAATWVEAMAGPWSSGLLVC